MVGRVACVLILAGAVGAEGDVALVYLLAAIDAIAAALLRPLRATLVPALARSPEELAANVASTTGDSLAALVGPSVAALLLATGGSIASTFVAGAATMVVALLAIAGIAAAGSRTLPGCAANAR